MGEAKQYKADVRELRLRARLTLSEVSKVIGISTAALSNWECGMLDLKFKVEQTAKILELYDVNIAELVKAWQETERQPSPKELREKARQAVQMH